MREHQLWLKEEKGDHCPRWTAEVVCKALCGECDVRSFLVINSRGHLSVRCGYRKVG